MGTVPSRFALLVHPRRHDLGRRPEADLVVAEAAVLSLEVEQDGARSVRPGQCGEPGGGIDDAGRADHRERLTGAGRGLGSEGELKALEKERERAPQSRKGSAIISSQSPVSETRPADQISA